MNPDGSIPKESISELLHYAHGFRNCFDFVFRDNGDLLTTENGPDRKDEFNVLKKGGNCGWPLVLGVAQTPGFIDPIFVWERIVSPTGMAFYYGDRFPESHRGALFQVLFGHTFSSGPNAGAKRFQVVRLSG